MISKEDHKFVYKDTDIIPKNASLVIARVPKLNTSNMSRGRYAKNKKQESSAVKQMISDSILPFKSLHTNQNDSKLSEEEKLKAVIFGNVSSNTVNNSKMVQGTPSDSYTCYRCRNKGHYIQFCPKRDNNKLDLNDNPKLQNHIQATKYLKTNHGIPSSFMTKVSDPSIVGARRLIDGTLGVNIKDSMALIQGCKEKVPFSSEEKGNSLYLDDLDSKFSNEMLCPICQNLFDSAVVTPCCGHSFCDFCIRSHLLENPESKCFHCSTKIDPEQLIKNTFLQNTVNRYKLEIGRISNQLNKPVVTNVSEASAEYTKLEVEISPSESDALNNTSLPKFNQNDLVKSSSETLEQVVERQIEQISRLLKGNYVPQTGFQKKFYSRQLLNLFHGDSSDYSDEDYVRCYSVRQTLLDSMENSVDKDKKKLENLILTLNKISEYALNGFNLKKMKKLILSQSEVIERVEENLKKSKKIESQHKNISKHEKKALKSKLKERKSKKSERPKNKSKEKTEKFTKTSRSLSTEKIQSRSPQYSEQEQINESKESEKPILDEGNVLNMLESPDEDIVLDFCEQQEEVETVFETFEAMSVDMDQFSEISIDYEFLGHSGPEKSLASAVIVACGDEAVTNIENI